MASSNPNGKPRRILLIDDDAISREVLSMLLELEGFSVESAEDGATGLARLQETAESPGIILMDTQMPGLSGLELIAALRAANARARIIAISGSEVGGEIREAADGFLLKPIQVEDLTSLLESSNTVKASGAEPIVSSIGDEPGLDGIDPVVLGKLQAMMPAAAVREIYAAVASDMETRLVTLSAAIDAGDVTEVKRIAHTIKGGCSMVGLSPATEAAQKLESSNATETWPKELLQLHFALGKLKGILVGGLL
jgi:CheY-like chemotaxis protein